MKTKSKSPTTGGSPCICQGVGPALSEFLRRLAPPEMARGHFETARVEFLKGLRAVLDARIDRHTKARTRGQAIKVE